MKEDICKLTGERGRYVKSHLLPKALTRAERKGAPFVQFGEQGRKPERRWSSWYDHRLVTRKGEDVLASLDDWAIAQLRKHKLIWSGWGPVLQLQHDRIPGTPWGVRKIDGIDPDRLRLFFLSLLWRAAATNRREFSEVDLPDDELQLLGEMLVRGDPKPLAFYPAQLTQISTVGRIHNMPPIAQTKIVPAYEDVPEQSIPIYRFYFDGLVCHIHRKTSDNGLTKELGPLVVGGEASLTVSTVTYEHSFERMNLEAIISEAERTWPDVMARL